MDFATASQKKSIASLLSKRIVDLSFNKYSCYVVEKAIICLGHSYQLQMVKNIKGAECKLSINRNGNHVIQVGD